ncbi:MAG: phospholipid carrier-dependent glycosyltransferase, partial [Candidatus Omnitrophica bacterium]|nr:phospholipid carrier-dependent glycosyltransferase [Candidatus Omnitrophota bacterium]
MNNNRLLFLLIVILGTILRLYHLSNNPPSLYWDEVSLGYNAFSILNYGIDEHGEPYPLARFIAFGDFKPPGYIYATVPSIFLFGVNEFAVRFPSAFSGTLFIVATYLLAKEIFKKEKIALFSALFIAISPWSLQLSRAAF